MSEWSDTLYLNETNPPATSGCETDQVQSVVDGPQLDATLQRANLSGALRITGNLTLDVSHCGKWIVCDSASAITVQLPASIPATGNRNKYQVRVLNINSGAVTIDRNGLTINGASGNVTLGQGDFAFVDQVGGGTNWYCASVAFAAFATKVGVQNQLYDYAADTGTANVYAIALAPPLTSYVAGLRVAILIAHSNTTASTLNVSGLGAIAIKKMVSGSLVAVATGDLPAGAVVYFTYDGTYFQAQLGGGGTPGGSDTQVQRNNAGAFGGISGATSDGTSLFVTTQAPLDGSTKAASTAYADAILALIASGFATKVGVQKETYTYGADSGAANAYVVALSPAITSYVDGQVAVVKKIGRAH